MAFAPSLLKNGQMEIRGLTLVRSALVLALAGAPALAGGEGAFSSTIQGISLRPEVGTGIYGYQLGGNLGGTTAGRSS